MRLVMDSVSYAALQPKSWPHIIGYANGRISSWSPAQIAEARKRDRLLALVDVLGSAPRQASVLDFERGDVQSAAVVHRWVEMRNEFRHDATVYVQPANIPVIVRAVGSTPTNLWVVDLTADGAAPLELKDYGPLPPNVKVIGRQFVFSPRSGGDWDTSVFYDDTWHPEQQSPAHYAMIRVAAAADLGPYENAESLSLAESVARSAPSSSTPPEPASTPGAGPDNSQAGPIYGGNLIAGRAPASAYTAAEFAAAAAPVSVIHDDATNARIAGASYVAATAPDSVDPAAEHQAAEAAATARQLAGPDRTAAAMTAATTEARRIANLTDEQLMAEAIARTAGPGAAPGPGDGGPAAAGTSTAAAAAAQPPLNHDFIRQTLNDLQTVANMFHTAGWHHVAGELERGLGMAWELGGALQRAGE